MTVLNAKYDISVVIPNYNSTNELLGCLEAIYDQQAECNFEVIVIDSSDIDPSEEIRKHFGIAGNVLLFFGFVREYKGLKYLLEAIPRVLSEVPVTLLVVREFWKDKDYYLDLVDKLRIKKNFLGDRRQWPSLNYLKK